MRKQYIIKYLRVGSTLINKHSGKRTKVIAKSEHGFKLLAEGSTLPTSELKSDMGLYFRRERK